MVLENVPSSKKATLDQLAVIVHKCAACIPSNKVNVWNFPKFHELLHLADNIEHFGSSINFSAQQPKLLLTPAAKLLCST